MAARKKSWTDTKLPNAPAPRLDDGPVAGPNAVAAPSKESAPGEEKTVRKPAPRKPDAPRALPGMKEIVPVDAEEVNRLIDARLASEGFGVRVGSMIDGRLGPAMAAASKSFAESLGSSLTITMRAERARLAEKIRGAVSGLKASRQFPSVTLTIAKAFEALADAVVKD